MKKLILGLLLFFGVAKAETTFDAYDFYVEHLPAVCGTSTQIQKYAEDNDYVELNWSLGRARSEKTGEPVFVITYWSNTDFTQTMATVTVPNSQNSCIIYVSFDVVQNEEVMKKKGKGVKWQEERYLEN
jgi:hypothetical protein